MSVPRFALGKGGGWGNSRQAVVLYVWPGQWHYAPAHGVWRVLSEEGRVRDEGDDAVVKGCDGMV